MIGTGDYELKETDESRKNRNSYPETIRRYVADTKILRTHIEELSQILCHYPRYWDSDRKSKPSLGVI